jgi:hypothetical protein
VRYWRVTNVVVATPHGPRLWTGSQAHQETDGLSLQPLSAIRPLYLILFLS